MILLRLALLVVAIGVLLGASSGLARVLPCPSIQPQPGLTADFYTTWSSMIFLVCVIYLMIPIVSFQFWAVSLSPSLAIVFVFVFAQSGDWRFALFLAIQCAITIGVSLTFNAVATGLAEVLQWPSLTLRIIALPVAYVTATGWGYVQAIGFAQSLC